MAISKRMIGFGLAGIFALVATAVIMTGQTGTTVATGGGPEMRLVITGGDCVDATCTIAEGAPFTMGVEVVTSPDAPGYIGAQSFMIIGDDLIYNATDPAADENVWPDCQTAVFVRDNVPPSEVNHGCLTGLIGPEPVTYTGILWELSFNCSAGPSSTLVELVPLDVAPALTNGAGFSLEGGDQVVAKVSDVTINCGAAGGETDTPVPTDETPVPTDDTPVPTEETPTATPVTPTPTTPPTGTCGDINGDGVVDSRDALWVLWFTAGLVSELDNDGDVNGDGNVTSIDASLILQAEASLIGSPCA